MSILLQAEREKILDERQIRDEMMTVLFAGFDTVAEMLSWSWYLLAGNPQQEQELHSEIDAVLRKRQPGLGDLSSLSYTKMVLQEALRLYPPAWAFFRHARQADRYGDNFIPREVEISFQSSLDPFSRAKIFVSHHGAGPEISPFDVGHDRDGLDEDMRISRHLDSSRFCRPET